MKYTETYGENFWEYNYPVKFYRDEDTGEVSYVGYMPRKEKCWDSLEDGEFIPKEELDDVIDNTIEKFETAIELFKKFKAGEIDSVNYWDKEE